MNITTKFNLGDTVRLVSFHRTRSPVVCPDCKGEGRLNLEHNRQIACQKCSGRGTVGYTDDPPKWTVREQLTLGRVEVTITRETDPGERESEFDNFGPQQASREERYMAYETGIGSGNNWNADDLFATRDEAQAECERRNAAATSPSADVLDGEPEYLATGGG